MKKIKLNKKIIVLAVTTTSMFLIPAAAMAITDTQTAPTGANPSATSANGSNGVSGGIIQTKPVTDQQGNINSAKNLNDSKTDQPSRQGGKLPIKQ